MCHAFPVYRPVKLTAARSPRRSEKYGAIAQLGERLHGMQEVSGSIPLGSTNFHCNFHCNFLRRLPHMRQVAAPRRSDVIRDQSPVRRPDDNSPHH
jgi:hypothetical protein